MRNLSKLHTFADARNKNNILSAVEKCNEQEERAADETGTPHFPIQYEWALSFANRLNDIVFNVEKKVLNIVEAAIKDKEKSVDIVDIIIDELERQIRWDIEISEAQSPHGSSKELKRMYNAYKDEPNTSTGRGRESQKMEYAKYRESQEREFAKRRDKESANRRKAWE